MTSVYTKIKISGGRMTKIRKAVIEMLLESSCLLTKLEIETKLKEKHISSNRSTLYREFLFLTQNDIIQKKSFLTLNIMKFIKPITTILFALNAIQSKR